MRKYTVVSARAPPGGFPDTNKTNDPQGPAIPTRSPCTRAEKAVRPALDGPAGPPRGEEPMLQMLSSETLTLIHND